MATLTVYGTAGDGYINSSSASYATARTGGSLAAPTADVSNINVGQAAGYSCYEGFIAFDTSPLGAAATLTAADLSLWLLTDGSTTDFNTQVRSKNWLPTLATADWVSGAALPALVLATLSSFGIGATGAYKAFTETGTNFRDSINKTGNTELMLTSDRHAAGNSPSGNEFLEWDDADTAGTTQDPKLVITYTANVTATPGVVAVAATKYAPTVAVTDNAIATPPLLELAAATLAPSALTPELLTPDALSLATTTYPPGVAGGSGTTVTPGLVAFTTALFAPVVTGIGDVTVAPGVLAMTVAFFAPLIVRPHLSLSMPGGIVARQAVIPGGIPTIVSRDGGIPNRVIIDGGIVYS